MVIFGIHALVLEVIYAADSNTTRSMWRSTKIIAM